MATLEFKYNDGGRSAYFKAKEVGDCVTRAFAIAARRDYKEVYNLIKQVSGKTPRNGVDKPTCHKVAEMLGGTWVSCMTIGAGCIVHLAPHEIPMQGRIVTQVTKHLTAVIDGVINDLHDPSRNGTHCVYGYWKF